MTSSEFSSKRTWLIVFWGLFAAILFNLAFPGGPFPWLAWVSMLPVFIVLGREKNPWLVCLGWSTYGIFLSLGATYWLYYYMRFVLEFNQIIVCSLMSLCVLISAIPYIVSGYIAAKFSLFNSKLGALKIAFLLSAFVALWPTPFPGDLSMSLYQTPIFTQIADIGGGHLIHFVIIWVNGLIAQGILSLMERKSVPHYIWITLLGIFIFIVGYGYFRLKQYNKLYSNTPINEFIRIGYIQPNFPGHDLSPVFGNYLSLDEKNNDFVTAVKQTKKLVQKESELDLIAWPETPKDLPYNHFDWMREMIADMIKKAHGTPFLFESMYPWSGLSNKEYSTGNNSIYLIKDGMLSYPYSKIKLIPFSEFLPGEKMFPFLRKWFPLTGDLSAGDKMEFIPINSKLRIIPLICYDGIFPDFVRRFALNGGNVFLSLDNDTNFGPTKASKVHASSLLYRAIENRAPLIRLSNAGSSFTVLSSGEILRGSETKMFEKASRAVTILPGLGNKTVYQLGGHYFPFIILIALISLEWAERREKSKNG